MLDQKHDDFDCQIGPSTLFLFGNNKCMHKSPIKLAKQITGYTQERLAEELGISPGHLSRMSNSKRRITTDYIERLASVCDVTTDEFYRLLGTEPGDVENASENLVGHTANEPLVLNPSVFKKAYERAKAIEKTTLGGRGSNADFAVIFDEVYADFSEQEGD